MSDEGDLDWLFEGVNNEQPEVEFAFELQGEPSLAEVLAVSTEEEARAVIRAVDDRGAEVVMVPLGRTSRRVQSGLFEVIRQGRSRSFSYRMMELPEMGDEVPATDVVQVVAGLLERWVKERPEWVIFKEKDLGEIRFYRFYFSAEEGFWTLSVEWEGRE